ncbi:ABC transporter substrate-binding protein [Neobacillus niacini]|uniref:ABC transporter substrate-binding protein n=1 Tax=Neobacillus niacini TaxID=86668 RepID=UPI002FFDAF4E
MKKTVFFFVLISLALMLAACSGDKSSEKTSGTSEKKEAGIVEINFGGGFATEEPLWLFEADPSLAPNQGKTYKLNLSQFRANADRLNAYQANQIDGGTLGQAAAILSASQGVKLKVVGVIAKDTPDVGFNSAFMTLKDSEIKDIKDLKGKTIGLSDFKSPTDLWVRNALRTAGLDPDKDVKYAITPIPAMNEAVKSGKIDLGMFPQPFAAGAIASGEFKTIFTSKTGVPFDEDFFVLFLHPDFIKENKEAVKDFLADYANIVKYYQENGKEARQKIIDKTKKVQADPEIYINMTDNNRSAYISMEGWEKVQELMLKDKWIDKKIDLKDLIDTSLLPAK